MFHTKYLFGFGWQEPGAVKVTGESLYGEPHGFGFVTEKNRRNQPLLQIQELNAGFEPLYWYQNETITQIKQNDTGCYIERTNSFGADGRRIPLCFKADVPRQGNYQVTITIEPGEDMRDILIFAGRRRLAGKEAFLKAGQMLQKTILINVCDIVPRGKTRIYEDKTIDLAVTADYPCISTVEINEISCPTIYIAGDSTVTDQSAAYPYAPGTSYAGWGQMLPAYLNCGIGISNHSHSGLTTESFRREGHYAVIDQYSKPKDYFFFQFGHNDQKLNELKAREGYWNNLVTYIGECRSIGAFPLLVTPVARNSWRGNDAGYNDLLSEYARVCIEIGREMEIPVLQLHERSMEFIKELGLERAKKYFYPNDFTHNNDYGAYKMAQFVAEEIKRTCQNHKIPGYRQLADFVTKGPGEWIPPEAVFLPVKPKEYEAVANPLEEQELFADLERPEEVLRRGDALDFVIKMARFFPINVYNDMFDDVVGHEWYAGAVECACQNGLIPPEMCKNRLFYPEQAVTLEEFIVFAMNGYRSRKPLPGEKECCYDGQAIAYARPFVRAAYTLGVIKADGSEDLKAVITREQAAGICRKLDV